MVRNSSRLNGSELKSALQVTLNVYDILGREVAALVNQEQKPGNYTVHFDASDLPSGIYIYRLQFDNISNSRKMVVLK